MVYWIFATALVVISLVVLWEIFAKKYGDIVLCACCFDESYVSRYEPDDFVVHPFLSGVLCVLCFAIAFLEDRLFSGVWRYIAVLWLFIYVRAVDEYNNKRRKKSRADDVKIGYPHQKA